MSALDKTPADESGVQNGQLSPDILLKVEDLATYLRTDEGTVKAVDGVSFAIRRHHVLGVVGESGCGKSMTALSIMQLVPRPHGRIHSGHIFYRRNGANGTNGELIDIAVQDPRGKVMRSIRGAEIAMIFQEPMTSLNPVYTIRRTDCGGCQAPPEGLPEGGAGSRRRNAGPGGHPKPFRADPRIPPPVERRHAAARNDSDGPLLQPAASYRR